GARPQGVGGAHSPKVPFGRSTPGPAAVEFSGGSGAPLSFAQGEEMFLLTDTDKGMTDVTGEVVFAGYALSVPEYRYDDFANVDVRDKVVLALAGAPRSDRPDFFTSLASAVPGPSEP